MRWFRLALLAPAWLSLGCDAVLSRWDKVSVEVSDPEQAAVDPSAGNDGSGSGDEGGTDSGSTTSGANTGGTTNGGTTGGGTNGGTTNGGTTDGGTNGGTTDGGTTSGTADTTDPVVNAGADTTKGATFSRTATATDASSMTYQWDQTGGGGPVTFSAATALTTNVTAPADGTYTIRFTATDAAGNSASDDFVLTWDETEPVALGGFSVNAGNSTAGARVAANRVTVDFPDGATDIADYSKVTVRRKLGGPVVDCQDGEVAKVYEGSFPDPDTFWDFTNQAGGSFDYKVCVEDEAGNETATDTASNIISKPQIIFITEQAFTGALSGTANGALTQADTECATAAAGGLAASEVQDEQNWKAVISNSAISARNRVVVVGKVVNAGQQSVADDRTELFSGMVQNFVNSESNGNPTPFYTLSGSDANGVKAGSHCSDWTSTAGSGAMGDNWATKDDWLFAAPQVCSATDMSLICIAHPADPDGFDSIATSSLGSGSGLRVTVVLPSERSRYSSVQLYHLMGMPVDAECDNNSNGAFVTSEAGPFTSSTVNLDDPGVGTGQTFHFRVCVLDTHGNVIWSETTSGTGT